MEDIKTKCIYAVVSHPRKILAFFASIVLLFALLLPRLKADPNPWLLRESHPAMESLRTLRKNFTGTGEIIFVLLEAEETVFNPATINRLKHLTAAFESISLVTSADMQRLSALSQTLDDRSKAITKGILTNGLKQDDWGAFEALRESLTASNQWTREARSVLTSINTRLFPVRKVVSLANVDNITARHNGIAIVPIFDDTPTTDAELAAIREDVTGNDLFRDILVAEDGRYTSIAIEIAIEDNDSENQFLLYKKVKDILEGEVPGPETHYISGTPVASATLGHTIQTDSRRLLPAVLLLVVLCLTLSFRMLLGVLTPLLVVLFSLVVTLGLKALLNVPINVITNSLPVFILSIGVADGIHIFSEFRDNIFAGVNKLEAITNTMRDLVAPVVLTSLTTALAFGALSITEIVQLRHFGVFVAAGTMIAMLFSLFFVPALLVLMPDRMCTKRNTGRLFTDKYLESILAAIGRFSVGRAFFTTFAAALIGAVCAYGASRIVIDNDTIRYQFDDSPLVVATEQINRKAAGTTLLNILIGHKGDDKEPLKTQTKLVAVDRLCQYIEERPEVGKVLGLTQYIKRLNYVLHNEDPAFNRLPYSVETTLTGQKVEGDHAIAQLLLLYENSGGQLLSDVASADFRKLNIPIILRINSSHQIDGLLEDIRAHAQALLPPDLSMEFSGSANIVVAATVEIVTGQVISLSLSFLLVGLVLTAAFRSFRIGVVAMLPLVITILFNFGIMGFAGIPLDVGTAVISSIVIGIGVDYSIHYLKRIKEYRNSGLALEQSVAGTVQNSGKAIVSNAFTVGTGFIAMLLSILKPLVTMGCMITVTMVVSALCTVVLVPAVLRQFRVPI